MSIIIPSKNIYEILEHKTILDNSIGRISAEETNISKTSQSLDITNIAIFTEQQASVLFGIDPYLKLTKNPIIQTGSKIKDNAVINSTGKSSFDYFDLTIEISAQNYLDLSNIHARIKYNYRYGQYHSTTTGYGFDADSIGEFQSGTFDFSIGKISNPAYILGSRGVVPSVPLWVYMTPSSGSVNGVSKVTIELRIPYYFSVNTDGESKPDTFAMENVEIEIYGNVYSIEKTITNYGSGKTYNLPGNELTQAEATIGDLSRFQYMAQRITTDYAQGKETMVLRCSISDYYNQSGTKNISITGGKMLFAHYDEVLPMSFGADGKDIPMSYKKDGTPKTFRVLGTRKIYDGAVWQDLYLQEI